MIPQLLLAHFIADYPGQTNWIFAKKVQGWPGLLLHGGVVLVAQAAAVFPDTLQLGLITLGMTVIHVLQDFAKIKYADRFFKRYPLVPYFLDQALHVVLAIIAAPIMIAMVGKRPDSLLLTANIATGLVLVTWTYYITFRVAVGLAEPYPVEWRWPGKLERAVAFFAALLSFWYLAPLAIIIRLATAWARGIPLTGRYFWVDGVAGVLVAAAAGYIVLLVG